MLLKCGGAGKLISPPLQEPVRYLPFTTEKHKARIQTDDETVNKKDLTTEKPDMKTYTIRSTHKRRKDQQKGYECVQKKSVSMRV